MAGEDLGRVARGCTAIGSGGGVSAAQAGFLNVALETHDHTTDHGDQRKI